MSKLTDLNMIQLEKAVRVAALSAGQQFESLPKGVDVPFEVADDFSNWCRWAIRGKDAPKLSYEQRSRLVSLDRRLDEMSGEENAELWNDDALRNHPDWEEVRRQARGILDSFGWSVEGGAQREPDRSSPHEPESR